MNNFFRNPSRHHRAFSFFATGVLAAFAVVIFVTHPLAVLALVGIYLLIYSFVKP